jgi:protein-tyrosine phosphatase
MIRIMFVCHGNICRSPMAEFVMKKIVADNKLADKFLINSSATSTEEIGNGIHCGTKAKLTEMNIPFTAHHAVQITKDDYKNYDYIIAMDSMNLRNLQRIVGFDNEKKIHRLLEFTNYSRDVADPWYTGNFDVTYTDIDNGCRALLEYIKEHNLKIN